jgi:uncharacterized protein (DUF2141 family)
MKHKLSFVATVSIAAVLSALAMSSLPARAAAACVNVEVQNVRPGQGTLMVAAYADAATFSKTPVAATQMKTGAETTMTFPLCGVAGDRVALTLYQDLNGNGKLDNNVMGIPTEPWGASGKPAAMSAPTWDATAVPLDGATIVVKLSK